MRKTSDAVQTGRRGFLKQVAVAGGVLGVGLSLNAGTAAATPQVRPAERPSKRPGYRETDHVRRYYEKASL